MIHPCQCFKVFFCAWFIFLSVLRYSWLVIHPCECFNVTFVGDSSCWGFKVFQGTFCEWIIFLSVLRYFLSTNHLFKCFKVFLVNDSSFRVFSETGFLLLNYLMSFAKSMMCRLPRMQKWIYIHAFIYTHLYTLTYIHSHIVFI